MLKIYFFLKYGYFPDYIPTKVIETKNVKKQRLFNKEHFLKISQNLFRTAVEKQFQINREHVIPLSGGLDSRAILAFLLDFTESKNIHTYTFGTPNTYDYEIGNLVAKTIKTKHRSYPLNEYIFSLEEEVEVSKQVHLQTYLFHHPPMLNLLSNYSDMVFWSGYIGDWVAGKHIPKNKCDDIKRVKANFAKKRVMGKNFHFPNNESLSEFFTFNQDNDPNDLSYEEQIEAQNFLLKCTAPHLLYKSFCFKTPHIDNEYLQFMLSLPNDYRNNEFGYKLMLFHKSPMLFNLPIKSHFGLPLKCSRNLIAMKKGYNLLRHYVNKIYPLLPSKTINYISFNEGIRRRKDLKKIIYENIMDLKKRGIIDWINIQEIWNQHLKGFDYTNELILLASLEIHLKAGKVL